MLRASAQGRFLLTSVGPCSSQLFRHQKPSKPSQSWARPWDRDLAVMAGGEADGPRLSCRVYRGEGTPGRLGKGAGPLNSDQEKGRGRGR